MGEGGKGEGLGGGGKEEGGAAIALLCFLQGSDYRIAITTPPSGQLRDAR